MPAGEATEKTVNDLGARLQPNDIIIDGGNSYFKDDVRRAKALRESEIQLRRCRHQRRRVGTGTRLLHDDWRSERDASNISILFSKRWPRAAEIFRAPPVAKILPARLKMAIFTAVLPGAGHFVKMVHNGIEYGLMQAYAEGFDIFHNANSEQLPEDIRYDLNVADIAEVWRRGSVVSSWLLDLTAMALIEDPELKNYTGFVQDSGEGRWTIQAAIEEAVPAEVLSAALYTRFRSRQEHTFAEKILSAMRKKFGGHVEPRSGPKVKAMPPKENTTLQHGTHKFAPAVRHGYLRGRRRPH